jgi:hypothetical protein
MGSKLDETHQDLTRFAAALRAHPVETLDEAAKKKVFRAPPPTGESRKDRKQQAKQERLYGGKEPLGSSIGKPYVPPKNKRSALIPPGEPQTVKVQAEAAVVRTLAALQLTEQRSSTTFKPCKERAMASTAHLRHTLPKPSFVKPDKDNPTIPIRPCRASIGGVARSLQKDMSNASEPVVKQTLQRANSMTGGTRGQLNMKLWGTGVGGQRMETFRGPPGTPKRTDTLASKLGISKKEASKLHGVSTGRADNQKHTSPYSPPGGSKGPAGNREVTRHPLANAKPSSKETGKKTKREEKREAGKIGRGLARIGK